MFCDRCGAPLQPNQRFCGQCGRDFAGAAAAAQFGPNRVQEHLRFIGILWLALGVLSAVGAIVLLILGNALFPHLHEFAPVPRYAGRLPALALLLPRRCLPDQGCTLALGGLRPVAARKLGADAHDGSLVCSTA